MCSGRVVQLAANERPSAKTGGVDPRVGTTRAVWAPLVAPVFSVFFEPIGSYLSRRHEFQADEYAIEQASGQSLIRALVKLYRDNASTLTPDPLHSMFYDSHPPATIRINHLREIASHGASS